MPWRRAPCSRTAESRLQGGIPLFVDFPEKRLPRTKTHTTPFGPRSKGNDVPLSFGCPEKRLTYYCLYVQKLSFSPGACTTYLGVEHPARLRNLDCRGVHPSVLIALRKASAKVKLKHWYLYNIPWRRAPCTPAESRPPSRTANSPRGLPLGKHQCSPCSCACAPVGSTPR